MSDIENFDIRAYVIDSIVEVFDTMLSMTVEFSESEPPANAGLNRMVGAVNFAGNVVGIFNFQVTHEFARLMTANMLGIEPEEVESDHAVKDLIAEISNIVGGNLKSALNDAGHLCVISTPAITHGSDFSVRSLNMEKFARFAFKHGQDLILVEVGLKTCQPSEDAAESVAADAPVHRKEIDAEKINALDVKAKITEAVIDVFDTMLSMNLQMTDTITGSSLEGIRNVGSVSFAGDVTGMISIQVTDAFARQMAAGMLAMDVAEIEGDDEVRDMLGELSNIIGGNLKSEFSNAGLHCALSTPSYTTGTDFKIESLNMEKYERFAFRCEENFLFVEMGLKISELLPVTAPQGKDVHYSVADAITEGSTTEEAAPNIEPVTANPAPPAAPVEDFRPEEKAPLLSQAMRGPTEQAEKNPPAREDSKPPEDFGLDLLLDIPLEIKVELGRAKIRIQELLKLASGSAIKLTKLDGEPVDILANDTLIARGEVVVQKEKYGIRITEITSRMDRVRYFGN